MLVLSRKINEEILIGEDVVVRVLAIARGKIQLGIEAPRDVQVDRREIRERREQWPPTCE